MFLAKNLNTSRRRSLLVDNEKAYTLVEIMVVMGIIAVIILLSSSSLYSSRKQAYLDASAKKVVSLTREAMNNSLSVLPEQDDTGKTSSAWVLVVDKSSPTKATLESYYYNGTNVVKSTNSTTITFDGGSRLIHKFPKQYLHLVYTAPFGKFYGLSSDNAIIGDWSYNPTTRERFPNLIDPTDTSVNAIDADDLTSDLLSMELGENEVELNLNYGTGMLRKREFNSSEFSLSMLSVGGSGVLSANPSDTVYQHGTSVDVTATPAEGYTFTSWTGCDSVLTNVCSVSMISDKTVTANFMPNNYSVTVGVDKLSAGMGTTSGAGSYAYNTQATIKATPASGKCHRKWIKTDGFTSYENPSLYNVTKNMGFSAHFNVPTATAVSPADNYTVPPDTNMTLSAKSGDAPEYIELRFRYVFTTFTSDWTTRTPVLYNGVDVNFNLSGVSTRKIEWQVRSLNPNKDCGGPWSPARFINVS